MQRGFVAATTLARRALGAPSDDPGLAKDPRDLELPPWNKGRYGTAIGRAVHATLQTVDIGTGRGVDDTAAAQAAAEGVEGHEATIAALVRSAIAGPSVRRAVECPHWREAYVAVMVDGITLEGYVDLLYRDDDGLVIVDYKTDTVGPDERATRAAKYRVQLGAYALAVAEATGEPVVRATLVFCDPDGAAEIGFAGAELAAAMSEARTLARRERDDPSPVPGPAAAEL